MSHVSRAADPHLFAYQLVLPPATKKSAPLGARKMNRSGEWIDSPAVTDPNRVREVVKRDSDDADSDGDESGGHRGFDRTV